jgi:hypothetical protein
MKNIKDKIRYQIYSKADTQVFDQVNFLIYDLIYNQVHIQVGDRSCWPIRDEINNQIRKVKS